MNLSLSDRPRTVQQLPQHLSDNTGWSLPRHPTANLAKIIGNHVACPKAFRGCLPLPTQRQPKTRVGAGGTHTVAILDDGLTRAAMKP
ncbi:hypothetical protein KB1_24550 [Cutibacterium modestum]|uniref:Uncharacterized protein n=1 Tax=Cutibacterium modestum TaxID=2559073 RepID=A0AAD1NWT7_9ACTN|nr:hypothetical protein KB1_24550 [Cutibacterium modestum]